MNRIAKGFTLIELMIVVAIIGILAAIAVPNFVKFQCRSKQSEAKTNLKAIYGAQESYRAEHDTYTDNQTQMGFAVKGDKFRYGYVVSGSGTDAFTATATGVAGKDMNGDIWTINQDNNLANGTNVCD